MKDIARRLEKLEQAVKSLPVDVTWELELLIEALTGLDREDRLAKVIEFTGPLPAEKKQAVMMAWLETRPHDELATIRESLERRIEEIEASLEGEDLDAE